MAGPGEYLRRFLSSCRICLYLYPDSWLITPEFTGICLLAVLETHSQVFTSTTIQKSLNPERFHWLLFWINIAKWCLSESVTTITSKSTHSQELSMGTIRSPFFKGHLVQTFYQINKTNLRKLTIPHFWRVIPNSEDTDILDTSSGYGKRGKIYIVYDNIIHKLQQQVKLYK